MSAADLGAKVWDLLTYKVVNRIEPANRRGYSDEVPEHLPEGGWKVVHYGIMVPGLPEPVRFFDMISIFGTATNVPIFAAPELTPHEPDDTAWLLLGSAVSRDNFTAYSISKDCDTPPDRSRLAVGDGLTITRSQGKLQMSAATDGLEAELTIRPSRAISHFVHIPGLYDHWSVLCEYEGTFRPAGAAEPIVTSGLCTWEYARGRTDVPIPMRLFTYQILNIDAQTQVLMVEVLGLGGVPLQRLVYVRSLDGSSHTYGSGYRHRVHEYLPTVTTPDGVPMRLPRTFEWAVDDEHGNELIVIRGVANDDYAYGMAAGYAGSYQYTGRFRGCDIDGCGYIEWIDRRGGRRERSLRY
ncbi:DUF6670 family protein [Gordonia phosphorivorans]|uniref:DUF6670 family protein n=1 Tax=Gordonia phosphorivorans TaxID=1056982 RepID=A0ABV6HDY5_9ACTN